MTRTLFCLLLSLLCCSCERSSTAKHATDEPAVQKPTATEAFNLATKCVELGTKINDDHDFASTENAIFKVPFRRQEQVSHYDPKTNRCYVELRVSVNPDALAFIMLASKRFPNNSKMKDGLDEFQNRYELGYIEHHLFDGQTGEELASFQNGLKGVKPSGVIKGRSTKVDWLDVMEEMNNLMGRPQPETR